MKCNAAWLASWILVLATSLFFADGNAFAAIQDGLVNGGVELSSETGIPQEWGSGNLQNGTFSRDSDNPAEGEASVFVDVSELGEGEFISLAQTVDATKWRGKWVKFRAAVRTRGFAEDAGAHLWLRIDGKDGVASAFDNMKDRPIRCVDWEYFEIVQQVDENAKSIQVGLVVSEVGSTWFDDASLEEASEPVAKTAEAQSSSGSSSPNQVSKEMLEQARILQQARIDAEFAPQQPFFTHWLWLPLIALGLFGLSAMPSQEKELLRGTETETKNVLGPLPKFALRFSVAYWLIYFLPSPFQQILFYVGGYLGMWYQMGVNFVVPWAAETVFGIEELVPPNGSGDTTFNYVQLFCFFVIAMIVASVWSLLDRRQTDYRNVKDLLNTYLRYVLALTMINYGLAKVSWDGNQFSLIAGADLQQTWGNSSPMGVLWKFMGTSRPYTVFGGLGECVGGVLLFFRRTSILGALVCFGVMLNVMMLNYCYDVPVKLYSTHLMFVSLYLLLPAVGRLTNVLLWNRGTEPVDYKPPYTGPKTIWVHRIVKFVVIAYVFVFPTTMHVIGQVEHFRTLHDQPEYFGSFEVDSVAIDGQPFLNPETGESGWSGVRIMKYRGLNYFFANAYDGSRPMANFQYERESELTFGPHAYAELPDGVSEITELDDDRFQLKGTGKSGSIDVVFRRSKPARLTSRGFRWINETPYKK